MNTATALQRDSRLQEGVAAFQRGYYRKHKQRFLALVKGQTPHTLFITCADSRISPNAVTDTDPGELFTVRNIGNVVHAATDAEGAAVASALEYGIGVLGVADVIVCGHSHCGACASLYDGGHAHGSVDLAHTRRWMEAGHEVRGAILAAAARHGTATVLKSRQQKRELLEATEKAMVVKSLSNLLTYPFVKEHVEDGRLRIHGWYYRMESGEIEAYDPDALAFAPLVRR
jgi:carbonic anhydrase